MKPRLIVFAKDPVPGYVKTRLGVAIGNETAAQLYAAMVSDLLQVLMHDGEGWDIEIHLDRHSKFYERFGCATRLQQGGNLGEKLLFSMRGGLDQGCPRVCVLGSDSPVLRAEQVEELLSVDADVAVGPTADGGYWGIAVRTTHPNMFAGVRWSTPHAMEDTRRAALAAGLSFGLGPESWDLDEIADLNRLVREGLGGESIKAFLRTAPGQISGLMRATSC